MVQAPDRRLILVSNRLPVTIKRERDRLSVHASSGGLVTALAPVLKNRGGAWIGWCGALDVDEEETGSILSERSLDEGYDLIPVRLTRKEVENYYHGFSNEILWPLFHDLQSRCNFDPAYWTEYQEVNRKFAEVILKNAKPADFIWIHDYHLTIVARELRAMGFESRLGFFLHTPFPSPDIFIKLPWRFQILHALLAFDLIGFQTLRDRRNFLQCVRMLARIETVRGKGQVMTLQYQDREVRLGGFPIGIDYKGFAELAGSRVVADKALYIRENLPGMQILLGIDRLDYTKGIPDRLEAFRNALIRYPELRGKITLVQVVVPSREEIPEYHGLKRRIERLVGEINGKFTRSNWIPIRYIYRHLDKVTLLAYYRTAEIALITPLKDGMNLIAKEYCASNLEESGILILSEFVGAASQLQKGAILVNPYDIEEVAGAINRAYQMGEEERKGRMKRLRQAVRKQDIFWWVESFLRASFAKDLRDFPLLEEYLPKPVS